MGGYWDRTEMLLGREAIEKLNQSLIIIYGIGGVGSYVCEGLVRSGVGHFILVDNDEVEASNVNRQIHATVDAMGRKKTEVMKERILSINPEAKVKTRNVFVLRDNMGETLREGITYMVDALDTVTAKLAIAEEGVKRGIPTISAMGMGNKLNPTMIQVSDIYETSVCPLCKVMRRELRKRGVHALKVVYSKEVPIKPVGTPYDYLAVQNEEKGRDAMPDVPKRKDFGNAPGSVSFVPSVAGMVIAGEVVKDIVGV